MPGERISAGELTRVEAAVVGGDGMGSVDDVPDDLVARVNLQERGLEPAGVRHGDVLDRRFRR
jgi:hypothetical protein